MATTPEAKARNNELRKEEYRWYRDHGICTYCLKAYAEPGRITCEQCRRKLAHRRDQRDPGRVKRNAYNRERKAALIEKGLCVWCGKRKPIEGQRMCPACRAKDRESKQKYEITRRIQREADKAREANAT